MSGILSAQNDTVSERKCMTEKNGLPHRCAHWYGNPFSIYITLTSRPGARKYSTPSFTGFWKMRPSASA